MQELHGETLRQDAEVRSLREENRGLAQRAALAEALDRDCAALKQKVCPCKRELFHLFMGVMQLRWDCSVEQLYSAAQQGFECTGTFIEAHCALYTVFMCSVLSHSQLSITPAHHCQAATWQSLLKAQACRHRAPIGLWSHAG